MPVFTHDRRLRVSIPEHVPQYSKTHPTVSAFTHDTFHNAILPLYRGDLLKSIACWRYLRRLRRILGAGIRCLIHTHRMNARYANLQRFENPFGEILGGGAERQRRCSHSVFHYHGGDL